MFLLIPFFWGISPVRAWNPEYAYGLPKLRRMCVTRPEKDLVHLRAIAPDEDCPEGSTRYVVAFAKEPRGSMALVRSATSQHFYPPLTLTWPPEARLSRTQIWHFTCVESSERPVLDTTVRLMRYKGEITSDKKNECMEAERRALEYCIEELKGQSLLESCLIPWGS